MKKIIERRIYNTDTATEVYSAPVYSNGDYTGSNDLMKTKTGRYFIWSVSNGQDLYRECDIDAVSKRAAIEFLDGKIITDEECAALKKEFGLEEA